MIPLRIKGFALDWEKMPIAILNDETGLRILPLWIGPFEASAIIVELENIKPPRPLTHDVFTSFFLRHGFKMDRLEIYDCSAEFTFFARIKYHRRLKHFNMEVRPSDGLALAVRLGAPIFASEKLFSNSRNIPPIIDKADWTSGEGIMFLNTNRKVEYPDNVAAP